MDMDEFKERLLDTRGEWCAAGPIRHRDKVTGVGMRRCPLSVVFGGDYNIDGFRRAVAGGLSHDDAHTVMRAADSVDGSGSRVARELRQWMLDNIVSEGEA